MDQPEEFSLDRSGHGAFTRREYLSAAAYCVVLLWINLYICRDLFFGEIAAMNSMHGFWAAIARLSDAGSWFHATWWPFWDGGAPFEFTYAPLVPALTAVLAGLRHVSELLAFQWITAVAYSVMPVTLFLMAFVLTRSPWYSFLGGLFYSLTSPTQLIVPDGDFSWKSIWDARRLYLVASWDDTPHLVALVFLPLTVVFLTLAIRKRRAIWLAAATMSIAAASLASAFGPVTSAMAALCLLFVLKREQWRRNLAMTAAAGLFAWAICAPFLSPSVIASMIASAPHRDSARWDPGSWTAIAIATLGWAVLWRWLRRWTGEWYLQFFALFAWLTACVPAIFKYLHRQFLPQAGRYTLEMELALSLLVVFGLRAALARCPRSIKAGLVFLSLSFAGEQIVSHRLYAKNLLRSGDLAQTIEYRVAAWTARNLPGVRVSMPGSIGQWTNDFSDVNQFAGGSWSMAYNQTQQKGADAVALGDDEQPTLDVPVSLAWLKAYGVGAVVVPGPKSPEFWKGFHRPARFEGVLPAVWRADDTAIYRIPARTDSLAHIVPETAIVRRQPRSIGDVEELNRYGAAIDDPSLPLSRFRWEGHNQAAIDIPATSPGQVVSIQVSWHPGWHATAQGGHLPLFRDALGLMWLRPECKTPCRIELDYDGGWALRLCRWVSYAASGGMLTLLSICFGRAVRKR